MGDRAIITLQLGNYANYVGAHFWNIQESGFVYSGNDVETDALSSLPCHDILYREGLSPNGQVTFTPRMVAVDLKGSLGAMPEMGNLYGRPPAPKAASALWPFPAEIRKEEPLRKSAYQRELDSQETVSVTDEDKDVCELDDSKEEKRENLSTANLDDEVSFWPDFLRSRYHPRSCLLLQEYQQGNTAKSFDVHGQGVAEMSRADGEELLDRTRLFAEEADSLQGFHMLADTHTAFGGMAEAVAKEIHDDYGAGVTTLAFPVAPAAFTSPDTTPQAASARFLNHILSIRGLATHTALTTPMSLATDLFTLPGGHRTLAHVNYNPVLDYHTAAPLAAALDTLSLPWRSRSNPLQINDISSSLSIHGRSVAAVANVFPFSMDPSVYLVERLADPAALGFEPMTPNCRNTSEGLHVQAVILRGLRRFHPPGFWREQQYAGHPYLPYKQPEDALRARLRIDSPSSVSGVWTSPLKFPVARPFPTLLDPQDDGLDSVAMMTALRSSKGGGGSVLTALRDRGRRINLGRMQRFIEAGLENDDFHEVIEDLASLVDNYESD
jgi:hypothetical protein